jgi:hypothetical protein
VLSVWLLLASYEEEVKRLDVHLYRIQEDPHAGHLLTADVDRFGFVVGRVDATTISPLDDMKVFHPDDVVRLA